MITNFLKIAFRNLLRYKFFSFINIFGLAIGIACCTVIFLFVNDELSYDKHNKDADRIYRVVKDFVNDDGTSLPDATTPPALAIAMQNEIPEIETVVRLFPGWGSKFYVKCGEKKFLEENVYRADSSIFDVFTLSFVQGNAKNAFSQLKAVVLTESTAKKYFGNGNAIGKSIEIDEMGTHVITAIIKDLPRTSHFKFDFLISTRTIGGNIDTDWGFYNFYTYIKLKPNTSIASVLPKIKLLFKKYNEGNKNLYYAQALTDIHLHSNLKWELEPNSDNTYILIFITIGLFIIVIAGINYVNLSTARASLRAKEIGIRKVAGAAKNSLIRQFLTESVIIAVLASIVAVVIAQLVLPAINNITHKDLSLISTHNYFVFAFLLMGAIAIGIIAGLYPALYLSSFEPAKVLKGFKLNNKYNFNLRKVLVIVQFTISIVLIVGTLIINRQVEYIQSAKLGFEKEQVMMIPDVGYLSRSQIQSLKNELLQLPGVKKVASTDGIIGGQNWTNSVRSKGSQNSLLLNFLNVDYDFIDALNLSLKEGRGFSPKFMGDTADGIILNETAVKQLGIKEPVLGKQIVWSENDDTTYYAKVIGVIKDFHFTSLRSEIKPFAFVTDPNRQFYFAAKLNGDNIQKTISQVQAVWNKSVPERPFQYFFLDDTYNKLYRSERNFRIVFLYITALAIIIACLGLFGLASFMTQQRVKEIGIRKVLGASVSGIVSLLSKDFLKLILIAALIAFPVAWFAMQKWLQDFAYRIQINWWIFLVAALSALVIALLTISFQAIKAAIANPVKSLRTE
ncbi:MAG: ABC transporter permease [Bacteroidia bacterium]